MTKEQYYSNFGDFVSQVTEGVENAKKIRDKEPMPNKPLKPDCRGNLMIMNEDGSLSLFAEDIEEFTKILDEGFQKELQEICSKKNIPLLHGKELFEITIDAGILQCKINCSLENFDELLKNHDIYLGYRNISGGLLSLKDYEASVLKTGIIRLGPVSLLDNKMYLLIGGCQFSEIHSAQLLRMIPDYDGVEGGVHHIHALLSEKADLTAYELFEVAHRIFFENNLISKDWRADNHQTVDSRKPLNIPDASSNVIIADLDKKSLEFYNYYGSLSKSDMLSMGCKSLEVDSTYYCRILLANKMDQIEKCIEVASLESISQAICNVRTIDYMAKMAGLDEMEAEKYNFHYLQRLQELLPNKMDEIQAQAQELDTRQKGSTQEWGMADYEVKVMNGKIEKLWYLKDKIDEGMVSFARKMSQHSDLEQNLEQKALDDADRQKTALQESFKKIENSVTSYQKQREKYNGSVESLDLRRDLSLNEMLEEVEGSPENTIQAAVAVAVAAARNDEFQI